jgi:hypothetical protein
MFRVLNLDTHLPLINHQCHTATKSPLKMYLTMSRSHVLYKQSLCRRNWRNWRD